MNTPQRTTRSNTNLSGFAFPEEMPDIDRRRAVWIQVPPPEQASQEQATNYTGSPSIDRSING